MSKRPMFEPYTCDICGDGADFTVYDFRGDQGVRVDYCQRCAAAEQIVPTNKVLLRCGHGATTIERAYHVGPYRADRSP